MSMTDDKLITIRNSDGGIVSMQGMLPNGEICYWIDEAQPFTDAELANVTLLNKHLRNLAKRVDKQMTSNQTTDRLAQLNQEEGKS